MLNTSQTTKLTPFYQCHLDANGKIVEFSGFMLPINYGSQIKEHECVRLDAGMFDVSHMCITDISGADSKKFMQHLISNDVSKLEQHGMGKALYSAMLNNNGGIIDDLIVYLMPFGYRLITNAATRSKVLPWIKNIAVNFNIKITSHDDLAMLAIQGPHAVSKFIQSIMPHESSKLTQLKPFTAVELDNLFIARTGYTGEDGLEIILTKEAAANLWRKLIATGITPCGLGARDTLRLEAGMNLYGQDMDETINPLECNMDWVVDLTTDTKRDFIGKEAYLKLKQQPQVKQVGVILKGKGVLRHDQKIIQNNQEIGIITSGTFSPTMKQSIAIARVKLDGINATNDIFVNIRGSLEPIKIVKLPFVRNGNQLHSH